MVRPTQSGLVARKLAGVRIGLFAHERYLDWHSPPKTLEALAAHILIGPDGDPMALKGSRRPGSPGGKKRSRSRSL